MHIQLVIRSLRVGPQSGRQHCFVEIDHEIFSTIILSLLEIFSAVILSLPLIQEEQLSVKECAQYWLTA